MARPRKRKERDREPDTTAAGEFSQWQTAGEHDRMIAARHELREVLRSIERREWRRR